MTHPSGESLLSPKIRGNFATLGKTKIVIAAIFRLACSSIMFLMLTDLPSSHVSGAVGIYDVFR